MTIPTLQVLEWGGSIACAYAGMLLAEAGVRVVRVVRVEAEPVELTSNPWFDAFLNHAKVTEVLTGDEAAQRLRVQALLGSSTLLLSGERGPADLGVDVTAFGSLSNVVITPFGVEGPYAGYRAGDLELSAFAGLAYLTPRDIAREGDGRGQPPLKMPGVLPSIHAGAAGAIACLAALLQPSLMAGRQLDVAMVETLIPTLRRELALYQYQSVVASRFMRVWQLAPWGVKPCRDGFVFVQVVEVHHWRGLVEMMGAPAWSLDERYCDPDYRFEHRHEIEERMSSWLMSIDKGWFTAQCQRRGLPFAPVNTVADLVRIPQLHFRRFFMAAESAAVGPCTVPRPPYVIREAMAADPPAPDRRQAPPSDPRLPLQGIRVADFGHVWAGPFCAQILADLGADVIKIESARRLDIHRRQGPYPGGEPGINVSGVWNAQNRGKGSATLDLTTMEGRELARRLVATCDVVIENFAPGVMTKLGLDYEKLAAVNPRVVMLSLSAFGQDGPQKGNVGYGPSLDAWSGLNARTAHDEARPGPLGGVFPDVGSAIHGAVAVLQALIDRQRTGRGRYVDVSELEVSVLLIADLVCEQLGTGAIGQPPGNVHEAHFPYGVYRCDGDDEWIALTVDTHTDWQALCRLLGREHWGDDPGFGTVARRRKDAARIDGAISGWTATRRARDAMAALQEVGLRSAAVNKVPDILEDRNLKARGYFQALTHPVAGPLQVYGPLWKVRGMPRHALKPAPMLGDATFRVLREILQLDDGTIQDLIDRKIAY